MANRQTSYLRYAIAASRTTARHLALEALTTTRILLGLDRQHDDRPKVHILLLHQVTRQEIAPFHRLISRLRQHYAFTDYSDAVSRITTGNIDRPYLSFTFDDGLRSCLTAAYVLEEFGTRGCFFLCPSMLSADQTTKARFCREQLWTRPMPLLNWSDAENLLDRGHEIGSHTWNHPNLATLRGPKLTEQLDLSKATLEQRLGIIKHFAWPYGRFHCFTREAVQAVQAAGYLSCASGERGCHAASNKNVMHPICIRRDSVAARWPWRHVWYFLQRSAKSPLEAQHTWPATWELAELSRRMGDQATTIPAKDLQDAA